MKATAVAPSNIAFTKYWGKKDEKLRLPENGSISMCLSNLLTTTTVEFSDTYSRDQVVINGEIEKGDEIRVIKHVDRIRKISGVTYKVKVVSNNNFPTGTGLSSSSSGFAALTLAAVSAAGCTLSEKELSILARQASGAACRSIPAGFVEWVDGNTTDTSYAKQIFPPNYWEICDVVAIVSKGKKDVPTSKGHQKAQSSPFMQVRLNRMKEKNKLVKKLIKEKNFKEFGELIEAEALELHTIMLTQQPPLIYWLPTTVLLMKLVQKWRKDGLQVYFTINTGQDVHIICQKKDAQAVVKFLKKIKEVNNVIINAPGMGARVVNEHIF